MSFNKIELKSLGDITDLIIDYRGKTPKKLGGDWSENGYRALSAKNVKTGKIVNQDLIRFVDEDLYKRWMKDEIKKGDILITSEAPFGEVYYWNSDEKIVLSQRVFGLRIKKDVCSKFIYYYMITREFQNELDSRATGTTVRGLRQPELLKCEIHLPNLNEQKAIAKILSIVDEKIKVDTEVCDVLEDMEQAMFTEWFVNYNFVNDDGEPYKSSGGEMIESEMGLIPKGWKVIELSDVINVKHGYAYKSKFFSDVETDTILMTPGNFKIGGGFKDDKKKYYDSDAECPEEYILNEGDLLVTMTDLSKNGDTLGFPALVPKTAYKLLHNQRLGKVEILQNTITIEYLYSLFKTREYRGHILGSATGTTVKHTAPKRIMSYKIVLPDTSILKKYSEIVNNFRNKINISLYEINILDQLRENLLPKLMSGEIRVPIDNN